MPDIPILLKWVQERQSQPEKYGTTFLSIRPNDNMLTGLDDICNYLKISRHILMKWIENAAFPCVRVDNAGWHSAMGWHSSISAIDQWIWLAAAAENEARQEEANARPTSKPVSSELCGSGQQPAAGTVGDHAASGDHQPSDPGATAE